MPINPDHHELGKLVKQKDAAEEAKHLADKQHFREAIVRVYDVLVLENTGSPIAPSEIGKRLADDIYKIKIGNKIPIHREAVLDHIYNKFNDLKSLDSVVGGEQIKKSFKDTINEHRENPNIMNVAQAAAEQKPPSAHARLSVLAAPAQVGAHAAPKPSVAKKSLRKPYK